MFENYASLVSDFSKDFDILNAILSLRYIDGETLTTEDEKFVVEKLLAYHPHSEDKFGCGLDSIMVSCRNIS